MKEVWKDIKGYEGLYQVSDLGNVKSLKRIVVSHNRFSKINKQLKEKILKQGIRSGYKCVGLCKNGKSITYRVNRLVAEAFISNPNNLPFVLHKKAISDGGGNEASNLYWGTQKDNIADEIRDGHYVIKKPWLNKKGKLNSLSKEIMQYTLEEKYIKTWDSIADVERELNINHGNICSCLKNKQKTAGGYKWKYKEKK